MDGYTAESGRFILLSKPDISCATYTPPARLLLASLTPGCFRPYSADLF